MATKNLQTLEVRNAVKTAVRVTGLECNGSMQADGKASVHFLSLLWHPMPGPFPIGTRDEAFLAEDTARAAQAVLGTGRSPAVGAAVRTRLAIKASRTVRSTRSSYATLAKRATKQVRG